MSVTIIGLALFSQNVILSIFCSCIRLRHVLCRCRYKKGVCMVAIKTHAHNNFCIMQLEVWKIDLDEGARSLFLVSGFGLP